MAAWRSCGRFVGRGKSYERSLADNRSNRKPPHYGVELMPFPLSPLLAESPAPTGKSQEWNGSNRKGVDLTILSLRVVSPNNDSRKCHDKINNADLSSVQLPAV